MNSLGDLLYLVVTIYMWIVIATAILSWVVVLKPAIGRNRYVFLVGRTLHRLTEPVLRPIRRIVPVVSGIDLSSVVLLVLLALARRLIWENVP